MFTLFRCLFVLPVYCLFKSEEVEKILFEKKGQKVKERGQDEKVLMSCKEMKGCIFQT